MTLSADIPVALMPAANAALAELGHGPSNFSIPLREGNDIATHAGLHSWDDPVFEAALDQLQVDFPDLRIRKDPGLDVNFEAHVQERALEWSDSEHWTVEPIMKGDRRTESNILWESDLDYNVWMPPVGWHQVVEEGYPIWTQPTGGDGKWPLGSIVTHKDMVWEATQGDGSGLNVWEPGVFGWTQRPDLL